MENIVKATEVSSKYDINQRIKLSACLVALPHKIISLRVNTISQSIISGALVSVYCQHDI